MRKNRTEEQMGLDDPATTNERAALLRRRGYLQRLYRHWYELLLAELPAVPGAVLELGSGGGFLKDVLPEVITSDVLPVPTVERVVDARSLPFPDASLRAIVGTNVLHHIPQIEKFFAESSRALVPGGRLIFVEPWPTPLSSRIYRHFHHEPFDPSAGWEIPPGGPLTAANGALPWILFERDRVAFHERFPALEVRRLRRLMPFSYLACGGIGWALPLPKAMFSLIRTCEQPLDAFGLFAVTVVEKTG